MYLPDSHKIVVRRDIKFHEEKAMKCSLEREPHLHENEEILVPKDELPDVDQPKEEVHGVEETTHAEKFRARWAEGVHAAIPPGERWGDMHD